MTLSVFSSGSCSSFLLLTRVPCVPSSDPVVSSGRLLSVVLVFFAYLFRVNFVSFSPSFHVPFISFLPPCFLRISFLFISCFLPINLFPVGYVASCRVRSCSSLLRTGFPS